MLRLSENPKQHRQYGYKPSVSVRFLRILADLFIAIFGLNGNRKLATEIQQKINPIMEVDIGAGGGGRKHCFARDMVGLYGMRAQF